MTIDRTLVLVLVSTIACSSQPGEDMPMDSTPPEPLELKWGPLTVAPGVEDVRCVVLSLGNDTPLKIHQIHNVLGSTSHHFVVYKTPVTEEQREPLPCDSLQNLLDPDVGVPLMITQKAEESLTLPEGVAFELPAHQMIRLELHYINASDQPLDVEVTSTFVPMAESEFQYAADFLFMGNPDIEIPPGQSATLGPTYFPMWPEFFGAKFFGFTGHQHQWGTGVYVGMAASEDSLEVPVYDLPSFNWDEPETVYHDPPITMPEGGGFRFTCEWQNMSDSTVWFGEGVDDEMCFFWAYYYPSTAVKTCVHTDQFGSLDVCCPGSPYCSLIDEFMP